MRKIILVALPIMLSAAMSYAQCGKKSIITSIQTEYLDANNTVQKTIDEKSTVEISPTEIIISPGNDERKMVGTIKSDSCDWKIAYKSGKSILKITFTRDGGDPKNATITIEGKDSKISFLMEIVEMPDRKIRVTVDKFEEKI